MHNYLLKLYQKVLSYCQSKYSTYALAVVAFTESSFFVIPPDALLIPLVFANPKKAFRLAFICSVCSVLGGIFGYLIGYWFFGLFGERIIAYFHYEGYFQQFTSFYQQYGNLSVFIAGFTPLPYKVATIISGFIKMDFYWFIIMSALSRSLRFFLVAFFIKLFEAKVQPIIEQHLGKITLGIGIVIIIIVILIVQRI